MGLISRLNTPLLQEAFSLMQHPEQAGWWGCALAQSWCPGQRWVKQSAQAALTESRGLHTSLGRASLHSESTLQAPSPHPLHPLLQTRVLVRAGDSSSSYPVKMHKIVPREIRHCLYCPGPFNQLLEIQKAEPQLLLLMGGGNETRTMPQHKCILVSCRWLLLSHLLPRN